MFLLILCLTGGLIAGALTAFVDFSMLRGEIFEGVRIYFARRAARRIDRARGDDVYSSLLEEVLTRDFNNFDERINETNQVYWQLAIHDKRLVGWLCPTCLNVRVTLLVFILIASVFWHFFPSWGVLVIFYLGMFAVSYLVMQKIV